PERSPIMSGQSNGIKRGVSFYSFQDEVFLRTMSLEDCVRVSSELGAYGVELIPEQSIPDFTNLSDDFVATWFGWMEKYGTTPTATNAYLDTWLYRGQWLSLEEQIASIRTDI